MVGGKVVTGLVACACACLGSARAQQVEIPRDNPVRLADQQKHRAGEPKIEMRPGQPIVELVKATPPKLTIEQMRAAGALAAQQVKEEMHDIVDEEEESAPPPAPAPKPIAATKRVAVAKPIASTKPAATPNTHIPDRQSHQPETPVPQPAMFSGQTAFIRLADGFDLPVGKPDSHGYYKARGFQSHGHLGEDWDGVGGGNTDLGDPIYCIGDGIVVFARDCHMGWGNVVIVRHVYRDGGSIKNIDSLYGHLDKILVRHGQAVRRGQQIATMGTAHGLYDSHLHLEVRKNITIGMCRDKFAKDASNYFDPSQFIATHRHLESAGRSYRVAMNTFIYDSKIRWDKLHNYSHAHTGGGSTESAYALKKALASQTSQ
jgi:murein DD-endopeptidase MepM/ murein hydrolase activator NlpD